jgi:hypothetical protein
MIADFIIYAFVAAIVFSVSVVIFRIARRGPERTIHDLIPLLEPINLEEVELLFDPSEAFFLRSTFSDAEFRALQGKRLYLAREYLRRMAHNAAILAEWADHELSRSHPLTEELASELHREAVHVRIYALFARMRLNLWILRLCPARLSPSSLVADYRQCVGIRGLPAYGKLKNTATALFVQFGHPEFEQFVQHL